MMEFGGKSCFNLGLDSKIARCLLIMRPTSGRFGLNVVTNGNNFFLDLARVLSRSLLGMVDQVQETVNDSCSIEKLLITKEAY